MTSGTTPHGNVALRFVRSRAAVPLAIKGAVSFVAVALFWDLLRLIGVLPSAWAPSVAAILEALWQSFANGTAPKAMLVTLTGWIPGLLIAAVVGVVWGYATGVNRVVAACSRLVVRLLRPVPSIAWIPIVILLIGLGQTSIVVLVVIASIWPILFNTLYAIRDVPEQYIDTARSLGLGPAARTFRVIGIAIMPGVLTGIRVSAGVALVVTVSAELLTGIGGIGVFVSNARTAGQTATAYSGLLLGGILGIAMNSLLLLILRYGLSWSPENRPESR